ncbi:MAG: VCBS repeat-containing protein [Planctomycetaceae bacterium]|nr:VCBS repeat-containing protein [Planctomycetaceae bacterium]
MSQQTPMKGAVSEGNRGQPKPLIRVFVAVLIGGIGLFLITKRFRMSDENSDATEWLRLSRQALRDDDYASAEEYALNISPASEHWAESRMIAGEAATQLERYDDAVSHYETLVQSDSQKSAEALFYIGEIYRHVGKLTPAVQAYREVLEENPDHLLAHHRLAYLLELTGQRWAASPYFLFVLQNNNATIQDLILFGDLEHPLEQLDYLERCREQDPDDPLVLSAFAAYHLSYGKLELAFPLLKEIVRNDPNLIPAQAMLGEVLLEREPDQFLKWHERLPAAADRDAEIWYVRGLWARQHQQLEMAIRCFWESVRLEPTHRRALSNLSQSLNSTENPAAGEFSERTRQFNEISRLLNQVANRAGDKAKVLKQLVDLMESTGRLWEAWAWAAISKEQLPGHRWPTEVIQRLTPVLDANTPQVIDAQNLALKHDFSSYPVPRRLLSVKSEEPQAIVETLTDSQIRFEEVADSGIDLIYYNASDPETQGARMFESNGGGVAVLDFNGDQWPDLYLTQGSEWATGSVEPSPSMEYQDRLYRNAQGERFIDVTAQANLHILDFGQGPTVGDFNNDGFPDLYVANIGRNRLLMNNGDGTFSDVTASAKLTSRKWTSSCAIVDLNADGLPDLFDANYLTGDGIYTDICEGRACSPSNFPGAVDDVYLNRGDGHFELIPDALPQQDSKGMGVVAVVLEGDRIPSLFVSNDQVPNYLIQNQTTPGSQKIEIRNEAFLRGLAFNEDGLPMACMGIAVDDVDSNGLLDLFVTNFQDEANTLYLQDSPGLFRDSTRAAGLFTPSFNFVGWGTQFLDADLDGHPDLVLVNGHVDDYRSRGRGYQMPPQFFRNIGRGKFEELDPENVGPYFGKKFLGRGLARLDWNRDGRMEFVVSNIGDRTSVLKNQSDIGHWLNLRLIATRSSRDAVGTIVTLKLENRSVQKQLTSGDGYMASNEKLLQFGLGDSERIQELVIDWPSGNQQIVREPPVDSTLEFLEDADSATLWQGVSPTSLKLNH